MSETMVKVRVKPEERGYAGTGVMRTPPGGHKPVPDVRMWTHADGDIELPENVVFNKRHKPADWLDVLDGKMADKHAKLAKELAEKEAEDAMLSTANAADKLATIAKVAEAKMKANKSTNKEP